MTLLPVCCPHAKCPSRSGQPFAYKKRGTYPRHCEPQIIQRFRCLVCERGFSEQTLRVSYRLRRPELLPRLFLDRISKVTHRQSARIQPCSRSTEERHFRRLSGHCAAFQRARLDEGAAEKSGAAKDKDAAESKGAVVEQGLGEVFLLDELETYEHHRKLKPLTVPVLIERQSGFVIDARVGTLAARGKRTPAEEKVLAKHQETEGRRRSESAKVVRQCFERLREVCPKERPICVLTDRKKSYERILKKLFGERCLHRRTSSRQKRDVKNPLWPINHTLARLRDGSSRLVRETWAASKKRRWLEGHLAIFICWRNYVRGRTNYEPRRTPAMALGAQARQWAIPELLDRRILTAG